MDFAVEIQSNQIIECQINVYVCERKAVSLKMESEYFGTCSLAECTSYLRVHLKHSIFARHFDMYAVHTHLVSIDGIIAKHFSCVSVGLYLCDCVSVSTYIYSL